MSLRWVLFDLNGTLLDPSAIADALGDEAYRALVQEAFDEALLYSMADTLSGGYRPLPDHLRAALERRLTVAGRDTARLDAAMESAGRLPPFPESAEALDLLRQNALDVGVLTNSATDAAKDALEAAGLRDRLRAVIGVDSVRAFKPHPSVYAHAIAHLDVDADEICMVSAHGWDVMGAGRAGMRTAWVARTEGHLPAVVSEPDLRADDLAHVARLIVDGRDRAQGT